MVDLKVDYFGQTLATPLIAASGTWGGIQANVVPMKSLGAIVLKTATRDLRKGNPPPRIYETPAGVLNSIGLENPGIDRYISEEIPHYAEHGVPLIASISGESEDDFIHLASKLRGTRQIIALELNLSCPNVSRGLDFSTVPEITNRVVRRCKDAYGGITVAKLTANVTDVVPIARAAIEGGADGISAINTLLAACFDWKSGKPMIANIMGGLSGPAIKPVAVRVVYQIHRAFPKIPIIGIGGIMTAQDVLEFMCAGAFSVQIGTGLFSDPSIPGKICRELEGCLSSLKCNSLQDYRNFVTGR